MNRYKIPHFLADTWWFALTSRTSDEQFLALVQLRQKQGLYKADVPACMYIFSIHIFNLIITKHSLNVRR